MPGEEGDTSFSVSSFFFRLLLLLMHHLSWHFCFFLASCTEAEMHQTANLEGLKEGLPHGRRERLQSKSCFFFSFILLASLLRSL